MAPRHPRKPVTMTTLPRVMMRLAAESDGKEGDKVAKLPWDTDSHKPTPNSPQPPSWNMHTGNSERLPADSPITLWSVCYGQFIVPPQEHILTACSSGNYPKEQVEEKQHVFNAADAATSHDGITARKRFVKKWSRVINSPDCCYSSGQQLHKTLKQTLVSCSQWFSAFYLQMWHKFFTKSQNYNFISLSSPVQEQTRENGEALVEYLEDTESKYKQATMKSAALGWKC